MDNLWIIYGSFMDILDIPIWSFMAISWEHIDVMAIYRLLRKSSITKPKGTALLDSTLHAL